MAQISGLLKDGAGNVLVGVPVVIMASGTMNPAQLFYDSGFSKGRTNPLYTDLNGAYGVSDLAFINASTYDVYYFIPKVEGMESAPGISGPLVSDTGGSVPPAEWAFAWTAGGSVTTSLASLFADGSTRTVAAGMRFLVSSFATVTNGATAGTMIIQLRAAAADTAVVAFNAIVGSINTSLAHQETGAISEVKQLPIFGVMTVITGGTLTLSMFGQCAGAAGTIAANGAGIYVRRLA